MTLSTHAATKAASLGRTAAAAIAVARRAIRDHTAVSPASDAARDEVRSDADDAAAAAAAGLRSFRRIVHGRSSARGFRPDAPVPDAVWRDVLHMTRTAPSGFNLQPTHVVLLRCPGIKRTLAEHAMLGYGNKRRTIDASGIAVFCSDMRPGMRVDRIHELERDAGAREDGYLAVMRVASSFLTGDGGGASSFARRAFANALSPVRPMPTMEDVGMWSYKNAGIMSQMYVMAASAHGLSTCMMEGYDARRAMEILRVPHGRYGVPIMVATGYESGAPPVAHADPGGDYDEGVDDSRERRRAPRLGMNELFFGDTFGEPLDFLLDHDDMPLERENMQQR